MNKSDNIQELAKALVAAQKDLKNPGFDSTNPHFKNKYASLAGVRDSLTPILAKHGLAAIQTFERSEGGVSCETILMHESGQWLSGTLFMPSVKQDAQGYGSAITYSRRYSLMAICGVVGDEDDDGANASKPKDKLVEHIVNANVKPLVGLDEHLTPAQVKKVDAAFSSMLDMFEAGYPIEKIYAVKEENNFDVQEQAYLWSRFDKKQKDALAKYGKQLRALHPATQG